MSDDDKPANAYLIEQFRKYGTPPPTGAPDAVVASAADMSDAEMSAKRVLNRGDTWPDYRDICNLARAHLALIAERDAWQKKFREAVTYYEDMADEEEAAVRHVELHAGEEIANIVFGLPAEMDQGDRAEAVSKIIAAEARAHLALIAERDALRAALEEQHRWHANRGKIKIGSDEDGWYEIDDGAEYSDSGMCERTEAALAAAQTKGGQRNAPAQPDEAGKTKRRYIDPSILAGNLP